MAKKDYYEILGLTKDASEDDIKKSYRRLAKEFHPDKNPDNESAKELFQEIQEAYEVLSDKDKKARYDQGGHNAMRFGQNNEFQKPFRSGSNIRLVINLTLEEIYSGVKKTYKYHRQTKCKSCHGYGGVDLTDCSACHGKGLVIQIIRTPFGTIQHPMVCPECEGVGQTYKKECSDCKGSGLERVEERIDLEIPHGIEDGSEFIFREGGNSIKGGEHGELIIKVTELPHKVFKRTSPSDLQMNLKLTYPQLVLGDKIELEMIDGGKIRVDIPEHSDVDTNLRIQGKGLKPYKGETRGDLIITLNVSIPKKLGKAAKDLLEKLKEFV